MNYSIKPLQNDKLSALITHFFTIKTTLPSAETMRMVPTGRQYLLFFVSGAVEIFHANDRMKFQNNVALGGIRNHCMSYQTTSDAVILGVSLVPNGLYKIYGCDFRKRKRVYAESYSFLKTEELNHVLRLLQTKDTLNAQVAHVEKYFESKVQNLYADELIDQTLLIINENRGGIKVVDLAKQLSVSTRHLERTFAKSVGTTPGRYAKMIRFKYAFEEYTQKTLAPTELIMKYNYVDYSHFLRDFKQYTGEFPKEIEVSDTSMYLAYLKALRKHNLQH